MLLTLKSKNIKKLLIYLNKIEPKVKEKKEPPTLFSMIEEPRPIKKLTKLKLKRKNSRKISLYKKINIMNNKT